MRTFVRSLTHLLRPLRGSVLVFAALLCVVSAPSCQDAVAQSATATATAGKPIEGIWQGTLHVGEGRDLRLQVKITDHPLAAMVFSVDQPNPGMSASSISFEKGVLKFGITGIDLNYEGKMTPEGNTLVGTSTQGGHATPLNLDRATPSTAWEIPKMTAAMQPMAANADPSFEVVTIKPSAPGQQGQGFTLRGDHMLTINTSVVDIMCFAYGLTKKQIVGGPDWMSTDKFDIDGKPDTVGLPSIAQSGIMLKKLLADRFQLKLHEDHKEMPAYVLSVLPSGPKLEKGSSPNAIPGLFFSQMGDLHVHDATMQEFAVLMESAVFERPVVDETKLTGRYSFHLKWQPDETQFGGAKAPTPPEGSEAPPLFTAIKDQLGMEFTAGKPQVPVLVIDHIDHPSAN